MLPIAYRGYTICRVDDGFRATPDDDDHCVEIETRTLDSMVERIDELWDAMATPKTRPPWLQSWMNHPTSRIMPDRYMARIRKQFRLARCVVAGLVLGIAAVTWSDVNGDQRLDRFDLHAFVDVVSGGSLNVTYRTLEPNGTILRVEARHTRDPRVDVRVINRTIMME